VIGGTRAILPILQQDTPDDYVLATGESHSVREFVEKAFSHIGRTIVWRGSGVEEKGVDKSTGEVLIEVDPRYFRPTEVDALLGDASKAHAKLGWRHKTSFDTLVADMMKQIWLRSSKSGSVATPTPEGESRNFDTENRSGSDPALSGADALRVVRARRAGVG
jgi:GDP-D-mannose dehydratase